MDEPCAIIAIEGNMFDGDDSPDPLYVTAYWTVYRFLRWNILPWVSPTQWYDRIKYFFQRGVRGWSDRDTWGLNSYMNNWMPDALRYLKAHKHGTPMSVFPDGPEYIKECGNPTDEAYAIAIARWDEIMDKMIVGFDAGRRIDDSLYEKELGPYPSYRPTGVSAEAWKKVKDDHFVALRALEARDQAILEEGLLLFARFFQSLWD